MEGWIKLHRQSLESAVFDNPNLWKVWTYCLMRANHKQNKILFGGQEICLQPGMFITGRYQGGNDCKMSPSTFRNQIDRLKQMKNLDITSDNKKSLITIVNWAQYQGNGEKVDSKEADKKPPKGQQTDTDKNEEGKNEKILLFEKFWELYDKKVGKEKTRQKFLTLSMDNIKEIIKHVPLYVNATPDKQYRLHPHSYLHQKGWLDELPPTKLKGVHLDDF